MNILDFVMVGSDDHKKSVMYAEELAYNLRR